MMGHTWNGEKYILGYKPNTKIKYDVGVDWAVGKSYPTKAWARPNWEILAKKLDL